MLPKQLPKIRPPQGEISIDLDLMAKKIVDSAYQMHSYLGPGLLESIYEVCFCYELKKHGLQYKRQVNIPIHYDDIVFEQGLRLDVLVEDEIICELKAIEQILPVHSAQLLSQLKLAKKKLGFVINFNVPLIKQGIDRIIL